MNKRTDWEHPDFSDRRVFACPKCRSGLEAAVDSVRCIACGSNYPIESGIPLLFQFHEEDTRPVTEVVKSFYETNPFPNYDLVDDRDSLQRKANAGTFARLLNEQIPAGALVLEVGCGTGQLTNFLGMGWNRKVFGADLCLNSLKLAETFRASQSIRNAKFVQMNLFRPAFAEGAFDVVISNGVLHHTGNTRAAFESIVRLLAPNGLILIGLYNRIGRVTTSLRGAVFRALGESAHFLDNHLRRKHYTSARKRAWYMDQYEHPWEDRHTFDDVLTWFDKNRIEFLSSVPKIGSVPISHKSRLFEPSPRRTRIQRWLTQLDMLAGGGEDGALFIMIGRRKDASE